MELKIGSAVTVGDKVGLVTAVNSERSIDVLFVEQVGAGAQTVERRHVTDFSPLPSPSSPKRRA